MRRHASVFSGRICIIAVYGTTVISRVFGLNSNLVSDCVFARKQRN